MTNAAFKLEDAGFTRPQVDALSEFMDGSVATKADIERLDGRITSVAAELRTDIERLDGRITSVAAELQTDISDLRGELKTDIGKVRTEIEKVRTEIAPLKWMLAVTSVGVVSIVVKSFFL